MKKPIGIAAQVSPSASRIHCFFGPSAMPGHVRHRRTENTAMISNLYKHPRGKGCHVATLRRYQDVSWRTCGCSCMAAGVITCSHGSAVSSFVTLVFLPWLGSFLYFGIIDALTNYSFNQDIRDPVILQTHHRYVESLRFGEITYRSPLLKTERVRGVDSLSQQQSQGGGGGPVPQKDTYRLHGRDHASQYSKSEMDQS